MRVAAASPAADLVQPARSLGAKVQRERRGTVALLVAVCLTLLLAIVAIALDGGALFSERRHAQAVADAAGQAAACDLYNNFALNLGTDPTGSASRSALATAAANGYANDGSTSTVTVNIPPQSGDYVGQPGYAEVVVQYNQQRSFSSIFASSPIPVRARSVVRGGTDPYSNSAIVVLDPSAQQALTITSQVSVKANAKVKVKSSQSNAVSASNSAQLDAPQIDIVGGYTTSNGGALSGTINSNGQTFSDPLEAIPPPDPLSLPVQCSSQLNIGGTSGQTLSPGLYKGGISITDRATVTLLPGIYYIQGGGFCVTGSASVSGSGVLIYNAPQSNWDAFTLLTGGAITLSAPTSGPYRGITFFQDRNSNVLSTITGVSTTNISGTLYLADANLLVINTSTGDLIGSQYICRQLTICGTGSFSVTWDANKVARHRGVYLVE